MSRDDMVEIVGEPNVLEREPVSRHTTFRIGGEADYFVTPETVEDLVALIKYLRREDMPYLLIGNGSNLLVNDNGYSGVMITTHMTGKEYASVQGKRKRSGRL